MEKITLVFISRSYVLIIFQSSLKESIGIHIRLILLVQLILIFKKVLTLKNILVRHFRELNSCKIY